MLYVILFLDNLVRFVRLVLTLSLPEVLRLSSMILVSLGTLLVIFVVFVLANMMLRPELFPVMKLSDLLCMVLTFWNRRRRTMIDKFCHCFKGVCSHLFGGCSICFGFARHFVKTMVQILKGGDSD